MSFAWLQHAARSAASARSADRKADQQGVVVQHCGIPWVSPDPLLKGWHDSTFSHVLLSVLRRDRSTHSGSAVEVPEFKAVGLHWYEGCSAPSGWKISPWKISPGGAQGELVVGYAQPLDALVVIKPRRRRRLCMSRARSEGRGG